MLLTGYRVEWGDEYWYSLDPVRRWYEDDQEGLRYLEESEVPVTVEVPDGSQVGQWMTGTTLIWEPGSSSGLSLQGAIVEGLARIVEDDED